MTRLLFSAFFITLMATSFVVCSVQRGELGAAKCPMARPCLPY